MDSQELARNVAGIIEEVRNRGDAALLEYTERWDRVALTPETLRVPGSVLAEAPESSAFAEAFRRAAERIERFHAQVKPKSTFVEDDEGVTLGLRWTPIRAVGLYVPGGTASYPSTLAMTAIPARIAGCERIVVVSPPGPDGEVSPQVLLAARVLGIDEVYRVGGAQAIAALALGTDSIPRVDKIFGPGNAFVAEAKQQLYGEVGIDLVAGPSEIVVYADGSCEPDWAAADLMAQAEHDVDTGITFLASDASILKAVQASVESQVVHESRADIIRTALERKGSFEVVANAEEAAARINEIAPEHLSIQVQDPWRMLPLIRNAGAIFLGRESPVAVGDYYAGPNHVLPTGATARFASCLSVEDFMKRSNVASMGIDFLDRRGADVEELAAGEGLPAHATSVRVRRERERQLRPRPGLQSVTPYVLVEEEGEVKLNQNESPFDVPEEIKEEVARRVRELPWNRYYQQLPGELAAKIAADCGVSPKGVVIGTGSNLLLQWLFEAYGGPGRDVLFPWPSFSLYPLWAKATESREHRVALRDDFSLDVDAFVEQIRRVGPALTLLCLPNNPTGTEMPLADVERVAKAVELHGGLLVIDEAYREFSSPEYDRSPLVSKYEHVVLLRTCSKAFSAAGARLGYLLASDAVAEQLNKIVPPFHVSVFHAVLGTVLWERRSDFDAKVSELVSERNRLIAAIDGIPGIEAYPSEANFFLVRIASDANAVFDALKSRGVLVRRTGDPALADTLRVNAGTVAENDRFLEALKEVLAEIEGGTR
ncbi:MAG: histidinol dehydrogenase [Planctomycetota bacterium]